MYNGLLGLHSLLRWAMIIFLVINIIRVNVEADEHFDAVDRKWSLRLLIVTHLNLVIGLYQYFFGAFGIQMVISKENGRPFGEIMKDATMRFWVIEHMLGMLIAIALITISHVFSKKDILPLKKHRTMSILYIVALLIILASVPWPFRLEGISRPWFRGLY